MQISSFILLELSLIPQLWANKSQEDLELMNPWTEMLWQAFWMLLNKKSRFSTYQQLDIHHLFTDTQQLKKKLKKFFWNQSMMVIFSNQVSFITGSTENGVFHSNIAFKSGTKYIQCSINWYLRFYLELQWNQITKIRLRILTIWTNFTLKNGRLTHSNH